MRGWVASVALCGAVTAVAAAAADEGRGFSVQGFQGAPGSGSFLTVEGSRVPDGLSGGAGGLLIYQHSPLVVRDCERADGDSCASWSGGETPLVEHHTSLELSAALGLYGVFEAGLALPAVLYQSGSDARDPVSGDEIGAPDVAGGLGDVRFHLKLDLIGAFGGESDLIGLALVPVVGLPLGRAVSESSYLGDSFATAEPKLAFGVDLDRVRFGLDAGYLIRRRRELAMAEIGPRLTYGAAVEVLFSGRVRGVVELLGETGFDGDSAEAPLEADAAVRIAVGPGVWLTVGGGAGLVSGVGSPLARVFGGVAWRSAPGAEDADGDGIAGEADECPNEAEDVDGFEDGDGCPDRDNDGDGLMDSGDRCPDEAEDVDGFEDGDGCPDRDNDGDGLMDSGDRCPDEAEDVDGFEDGDGCPDPENDGEGVAAADDLYDGEPETDNGLMDGDGFPDEGDELVIVRSDRIELLEPVRFRGKTERIRPRSRRVLDAVADALGEHPQIRVRIGVYVGGPGRFQRKRHLAERRALELLRYLVENGVDPDRLVAVGHGQRREGEGGPVELEILGETSEE
jgi:large repetitive protein